MQQNTFEKKLATLGGMHMEQIFELIGPGPHGRMCNPIIDCFPDTPKISMQIFEWTFIYS